MSKTIAVFGATGTQGSSVVEAFASDSAWTVRAITRNASSKQAQALAQKYPNIKLVEADMADVGSLQRALTGCTAVFAVTDYWAPFKNAELRKKHATGPHPGESLRRWAYDQEVEHGKNIANAAATIGDTLTHFIWSGLPSCKKYSQGKYSGIYHFDSKAAIADYIRENQPELAGKMSVLYIGFYASNMHASNSMTPMKRADGTFLVQRICPEAAKHPFILTNQDTGPLTKALTNTAPGKTLLAYTAMLSWGEMAQMWGRVMKQKVQYREVSLAEFKERFPVEGEELLSATYSAEFGFAGHDPEVIEPKDLGFRDRPDEIEEWMAKQDWKSVLESDPVANI